MPKMTKKYAAALELARKLGQVIPLNQEPLYQSLNDQGHHWNSDTGAWEQWANEPADEPTEFIMIRVWSAADVIGELANDVITQMRKVGLRLMEQSEVFPCRPPKQLEARVYLKFLPERKFKK
jgi:hypothetical protein